MTTPHQRRDRRVFPALQDAGIYGPTGEPLVPQADYSTRSLTAGGVANDLAGIGSSADKAQATYFTPTRFFTRYPLEILYIQSWAAAHFVNMPIDDMWVRGREWELEDEAALERLEKEELALAVNSRLSRAMKAGRLYGTGLAVMMTNEAMPEEPLNVESIREGDLTNILVVDRYSANPLTITRDPFDNNYNKPELYEINLEWAAEMLTVHHSRILRFDGREALTSDGWSGLYDRDWGISELLYAITEIIHQAGLSNNIAQLSYEASIPVVKSDGFRDTISGEANPDDPSVQALGSKMNLYKSLYGIMFMDVTDEFERVAVSFAGIADIMDQYWKQLAAIAEIPATRFLGRSPEGMDATGDSDSDNYTIAVKSKQERMLKYPLSRLDEVVARHLGMGKPPMYMFRSLTDVSDKAQAEVAKIKADALAVVYDRNALTEDEMRERLSGDPLFGMLDKMPEIPDNTSEGEELDANGNPIMPPNQPNNGGEGEGDDA